MGLFSKKNKEVKTELFTVEHEHQIKEQRGNTSRVNPAIQQEQHVPTFINTGETYGYSGSTYGYSGLTEQYPGDLEIVPVFDPINKIMRYEVKPKLSGSSGTSGSSSYGKLGSSGTSGTSGTYGRGAGTSSFMERPWWSVNPELSNKPIVPNEEFRQSLRSMYQIDEDVSNIKQVDIDDLYRRRREFPFGTGIERQMGSDEQDFKRLKKIMDNIGRNPLLNE